MNLNWQGPEGDLGQEQRPCRRYRGERERMVRICGAREAEVAGISTSQSTHHAAGPQRSFALTLEGGTTEPPRKDGQFIDD